MQVKMRRSRSSSKYPNFQTSKNRGHREVAVQSQGGAIITTPKIMMDGTFPILLLRKYYFHQTITPSQRLAVYCTFEIDTSRIPRNATMARPFLHTRTRIYEQSGPIAERISQNASQPQYITHSRFLPSIDDMQIRKWARR